ncbi:MAG: DUF3494 domain-containing protein [Methylophilaceae bacterium]|nr:DUF3494 domain-containing protein [Methylophilaceae bacterium]
MNCKKMNWVLALALPLVCMSVQAATISYLGFAQKFGVLAGSTITNTGTTSIHGDIGVSPGTAIADNGTIVLNGTQHLNDGFAQQAQIDALSAYTSLASQPFTTNLSGQDLGAVGTLSPGVYRFDSSAQLTGTLTLDAMNDPNALFIFQIGSALTSASNSSVSLLNGGPNTGLYFQVGSSATLGTGSMFVGNILADQSITLTTASTLLFGRAIALNGAVTLDSNKITNDCLESACGTGTDFGSVGFSGGNISAVPVPAALPLMATALGIFGLARRRIKAEAVL